MRNLRFDNQVLRRLPIDSEVQNFVREVKNACFSIVKPTPVTNPSLVAVSPSALGLLGVPLHIASKVAEASPLAATAAQGSTIDKAQDTNASFVEELTQDLLKYLSGNEVMEGSEPASHCYCGHQFGSFAGQLGDGAAIYLGEVVTGTAASATAAQAQSHPDIGATGRWELQLKGAGPTPYSRSADGRKVLRSSLREFIGSEYMHAAGIPTTRAGSLITSDTRVERDPIYSGNVVRERCTVISRIAETFIRFGSFEICKPRDGTTSRAGPSAGNTDVMNTLFTYVAEVFFPEMAQESKRQVDAAQAAEAKVKKAAAITQAVATANGEVAETSASAGNNATVRQSWQEVASTRMLSEICERTAQLVAKWQAIGWVHGVLNTDNMSIIGLTIDYGPYGFMTHFDNDFVPNLSDHGGRYSYKQQPAMCQWNLTKLAEAWSLLFPAQKERYSAIITEHYGGSYNEAYKTKMAAKLGINYEGLMAKINSGAQHGSSSDSETPTTRAVAALEEQKQQRLSMLEDIVMEIIGELVFALQMSGAEFTNTFKLLQKAAILPDINETSSGLESAKANTDESGTISKYEASDLATATKIADLCISPNARQKVLKRRMSELKPSLHPQQIEQLLNVASVDPLRLRDIFGSNVEPEQLVLFLKEEQQKVKDGQRINAEFIQLMGVTPEVKKEADIKRWVGFIVEYRKAMAQLGIVDEQRRAVMADSNPVFVPFPWVLQDAISQAENGEYTLVRNLLDRCGRPFREDPRDDVLWKMAPPPDAEDICVSCSS